MTSNSGSGYSPASLLLIGWKEYLDFPEWGIQRVKAKVDTGARTSALDVTRYVLEQRGPATIARMELALNRRRPAAVVALELPVLRLVVVKSSNGDREERPVIETLIRLGPVEKRIMLTVTDRSSQVFPVLLGREALARSFLVDVGQKYLLGKSGVGRHRPI
jgi:hypothetical protein